jgi:hypothetical protein
MITMFFVVASLCTVVAYAEAGINASEQRVLDELSKGVSVNGKLVKVPVNYLNQAKNYLASSSIDLTKAEADYIISKITAGKQILISGGVVDLGKLSTANKLEIIALAKAAASEIDLTLTYNSVIKIVTIVDKDGVTVFTAEDVVKTTGDSAAGTVGVLLVCTGAVLFLKGRKIDG